MNCDELLIACKLRAGLTSPATGWTPDQIVIALNEELWTRIVPKLVSTNGEFFVTVFDQAISGGQTAYPLPPRVSAGALRVVKYVDSNGTEGAPIAYIEVPDTGRYNVTTGNAPLAFYFTGTEVNLLPSPSTGTTGTLRMYYHRRPGALVQDALDDAGRHTAVGTVTNVSADIVSIEGTHNGFTSGALLDFVAADSPHRLLASDIKAKADDAGSNEIHLTASASSYGISPGDFVTLAQQSYVPQGIPLEWHSLLELATGARILGSLGDLEGQRELLEQSDTLVLRLNAITEFRSTGNTRKINAWR